MIFAHLTKYRAKYTSNCNRLLVYQSEFKTENIKSNFDKCPIHHMFSQKNNSELL